MQNARGYQVCEPITPAHSFFASSGKKPVNLVSLGAHENNALYLWTACFGPGTTHRCNWRIRSYNSYRYTIPPISDYDGLGGGTIVLVAPFILFLVALYFFFFLRVHS